MAAVKAKLKLQYTTTLLGGVIVLAGIMIVIAAEMMSTEMITTRLASSVSPPTENTILIYLQEQCYDRNLEPQNLNPILNQSLFTNEVKILFINNTVTCHLPDTETLRHQQQLSVLVELLSRPHTIGLVGSPPPPLCETLARLSRVWHKHLVTWTCSPSAHHTTVSQKFQDDTDAVSDGIASRSLLAPINIINGGLVAVLRELRWKSVIIITSDEGWWRSLAHALDLSLRIQAGIVAKLFITVPQEATNQERIAKLLPLNNMPCRAIIICTSLRPLGQSILSTVDNMRMMQRFGTFTILIDPASITPYLPPITSTVNSNTLSSIYNIRTFSLFKNLTNTLNVTLSSKSISPAENSTLDSNPNNTYQENSNQFEYHFQFIKILTQTAQKQILVYTALDSRENISEFYSKSYQSSNFIWNYLNQSFNIISQEEKKIRVQEKYFQFVLLDWCEVYDNSTSVNSSRWRPIVRVAYNETNENSHKAYTVSAIESNFDNWKMKSQRYSEICDDDLCPGALDLPMNTTQILIIVICTTMFAVLIVLGAVVARNHVVKKRLAKGPYKILLTATDFVFPTVADSRRVDEGIEAMLCCWLQQLQEFGGPEVDKPDLLKGSVASLKGQHGNNTKGAGSSTGSIARTLLVDPRVRYNGDLVQLKELPSSQGTFELKSKAMDVLVMIHGLRHENINPLIGCLTEPTRPSLVFEWCTRGSLEDVLVQDEIKLDWSFRLSLLTDLVRGMRYLHSTPIRVHGYLTSRNCVIDARWVLKITDYGLPAFYDTQNITPPAKSARDLLWTAPELLRHVGLRKRGTQPGDVYSFGIIMQEVVVRGEPFCMLALTPEEIIEKVKRPPPLIRPSVSKGAAPPEAINIMRQCWAEQADMRPDFNAVHDLFKKLNHGRKVNFVDTMFQMLEKYSNNLEELIRERTEQLDMEKKKTEQLLNRMLPSSVAEKLKLGMPVDPEEFREVTIYFSDIVGFTTISAYSTPFQVVDLLNDLYTCFDATINAYNVYKVETIGDAYMVVGGLPVPIPDHSDQVATMALDLLHQSGKFKIRHLPKTPLRLRIGLHTGPCCAGVVGLTMPRYCLFGDTVNTASRMESTGSAWRIHLSQATKDKLDQVGGYQIEYRGPTEIKGKGRMQTYWLLGKTGFDKQLPMPPSLGESHGLDESLVILGREGSHNSSFNANRSEDNSSGECSSSFGIPAGQVSPCPIDVSDLQNNLQQSSGSNKSVIKVCAAVHHDDSGIKNHNISRNPVSNDSSKLSNISSRNSTLEQSEFKCYDPVYSTSKSNETSSNHVFKNVSGDASLLGTPVSASEVAAALLGTSSTSLSSSSNLRSTKYRRVGVIDEDDLSSPYNHYRCISPNDSKLPILSASTDRNTNRFLKRQFSLDRGDDPSNSDNAGKTTPRLSKQNSAGAAHDLERIEEIPLAANLSPYHYRNRTETSQQSKGSLSISVDSISLH